MNQQLMHCNHKRERFVRTIQTDAGPVELVVCVACDGRRCSSCHEYTPPSGMDGSPTICMQCGRVP